MKTYLFKNPTAFLRYQRQDLDETVEGFVAPVTPWEEVTEWELQNWLIAQPQITRTQSYRVSKETMIRRIRDIGMLGAMRGLVVSLPADKQFEFTNLTSFACDNPEIVGGLVAIGLRPGEILAPDPLIEE